MVEMYTIDFPKLCCNDYPALVWYRKSTGKDLCNRGCQPNAACPSSTLSLSSLRLELSGLRFFSTLEMYKGSRFANHALKMTDLLHRIGSILLVLAVISFFVCTLPVWLIVLVVVLLLG